MECVATCVSLRVLHWTVAPVGSQSAEREEGKEEALGLPLV